MRILLLIALLLIPCGKIYAHDVENSVYAKVIKSGKLRCGYGIFPGAIYKDPNTGELSGLVIEFVEELGKITNLKIEWTEEIDWGNIGVSLQSRKIDAMCAAIWASAGRGRVVAFSNPIFLTSVDAFVRSDDLRFEDNIDILNSPEYVIATNHGDVSEELANRLFPKAKKFAKSQIAGEDQLFMNVLTKKADITFSNAVLMNDFNKNNDNGIRKVKLDAPFLIYKNTIGVDIHERELLSMINTAVDQLVYSGYVDYLLDKYKDNVGEIFIPVAKPYGVRK